MTVLQTEPARRRMRLSRADVERLLSDAGPDARVSTLDRLVGDMRSGQLTEGETRIAREVLAAFAADAEAEVRAAVAWQIHNTPLLTAALAERLARDVGCVAFPILRHAELLSDELLLEIVGEEDPHKQLAIAGRRELSTAVSAALIETGNIVTVVHLLRNRGANVAEAALNRAIDRFGQLRAVAEGVAARPELTMSVVERLIAYVSADIREMLVTRYRLEPKLAERLAIRGREAATLRLLRPLLVRPDDAEMVARHLHRAGRLTPQLMFRALCGGDTALFEAGVAERAGITPQAAQLLSRDDGKLGLRCLFDAADLPWSLSKPFRVAIRAALDSGWYEGRCSRERFQSLVLDRLFSACGNTEDREVDELLMQLCDSPGLNPAELLLPVRD